MRDTLADKLAHHPRELRIHDMLLHYHEAQETLACGQLGDGSGVTLMPEVWSRSGYPILEKLLKKLREEFEAEETWPPYWHVREWYFRSRTVRKPIMRHTKRGPQQAIVQGVPQYELVRVSYLGLPDEVVSSAESQVRRALSWLAGSWPEGARFQPETVDEIVKRLERARMAA